VDGIGYFIVGLYAYVAIAIGLSVFALIACKRISNPWRRGVARLLIVLAVYTPVPQPGDHQDVLMPAFLAIWGSHNPLPNDGWLSHPFLMAYGGALLLGLPLVLLWAYVTTRYSRE